MKPVNDFMANCSLWDRVYPKRPPAGNTGYSPEDHKSRAVQGKSALRKVLRLAIWGDF